MSRSAQLRAEADYAEEQEKLAAEALSRKGKLAKYWSPQYGTGMGNKAGEFKGLSCKSCNRWEECGHEDDCAVAELEDSTVAERARLLAIVQAAENVVAALRFSGLPVTRGVHDALDAYDKAKANIAP